MEDIFDIIKETFNSLWSVKKYGKTIEIVTPLFTTNDCFVSIFITERNGRYIVTDGGWISDSYYNNFFDNDDEYYQKLFTFYKERYLINETESKSRTYYFKSTDKKELVPNIAFEMTSFISAVVSSSFIKFQDNKDSDLQKRFGSHVNNYLSSIIGVYKNDLRFNSFADDRFKDIRFNAVYVKRNRFTLMNYVTGTSEYYFRNSISRSILNFQLINKTYLKETISKRVTVVNDTAVGYLRDKFLKYLEFAETDAESDIVLWSNKRKLLEYVE